MGKANAAEAIYGFISWAATRKEDIMLGQDHPTSFAIESAQKFIEANKWASAKEGWDKRIVFPIDPLPLIPVETETEELKVSDASDSVPKKQPGMHVDND
jgi:hypothetical protein